MKTWHCGDCGAIYPMSVRYCQRPFDDYLSLRGGTIESAMQRAVAKAIEPLVEEALRKLRPQPRYVWPTPTFRPARIEHTFPLAA